MKMTVKYMLLIGSFIFLIVPYGLCQVTSPNEVQQQNNYSNWDSNQDDQLDSDEFMSGFGSGAYGSWDANGDEQIDEDEWKSGMSNFYPDYSGMYSDWDMDGDTYLNQDEFSESTFNLWDEDTDGYISQDEFNTWSYDSYGEE